ncbi:MAG: UrcA family protein [Steroidobacteraceae bacterium]
MMSFSSSRGGTAINAAMLIAAGFVAAAPIAADAAGASSTTIVIQGSRETRKVIGRSDIGAPIVQVDLSHTVSYADLNLASASGAETLRQRVDSTAHLLCRDLDQLYPLESSDPMCAKHAVHMAKSQVDAAIAAASARRSG